MNSKPLVSIIVPIYNSETFLDRCIKSLINQTLKDIEIILVNDASPDNSKEIMERYARYDNRIITIHNEKNGSPKPRNEGMRMARGEYLGFVDADDWVDLDMYEKLYTASNHGEIDVVIGNKKNCYSDGRIEFERQFAGIEVTDANIVKKNVIQYGGGLLTNIWKRTLLFPKLLFSEGLFYSDTISIAWYLSAGSFARVENFGYNYYINSESITRKMNNPLFWHRTTAAIDMRKRCIEMGLYNSYKEEVDYAFYRLFFRNTIMLLYRSWSYIPIDKLKKMKDELNRIIDIKTNLYYIAHKNDSENISSKLFLMSDTLGLIYLRMGMLAYKLRIKMQLGKRLRKLKQG